MKLSVIACSMLEDEVRTALERCGLQLPVVWMERGLHEQPDHLRQALIEAIAAAQDADVILLTYGLCGGALDGVSSPDTRLVLPRFHDCIHMLTSHTPGSSGQVAADRLYLTAGWLRGERTLDRQYRNTEKKYGAEQTRWIYQQIMGGYHGCCLLDTGAYSLPEARSHTAEIAHLLELPLETAPGTIRILEKLFSGRWDEEFLSLAPGEAVRSGCFYDWPDAAT